MLQVSFKRYVSESETKLIEGCLANTIACDSEEMHLIVNGKSHPAT